MQRQREGERVEPVASTTGYVDSCQVQRDLPCLQTDLSAPPPVVTSSSPSSSPSLYHHHHHHQQQSHHSMLLSPSNIISHIKLGCQWDITSSHYCTRNYQRSTTTHTSNWNVCVFLKNRIRMIRIQSPQTVQSFTWFPVSSIRLSTIW